MENVFKEVYFEIYCPKCEHHEKTEQEDPCWDCLNNPVNEYSHKPTHYKEKDT